MGIDATRPLDKPKEKFEKARTVSSKRVNEVIEELRKFKA